MLLHQCFFYPTDIKVMFGWMILPRKQFPLISDSVNRVWKVLHVIDSQRDLLGRFVNSFSSTSEWYAIPLALGHSIPIFRSRVKNQTKQVNNRSTPVHGVTCSPLRLRWLYLNQTTPILDLFEGKTSGNLNTTHALLIILLYYLFVADPTSYVF